MTSSIIAVTLILASLLVQGKLVVGETNESEVNGSDSHQTPSSNAGASPPSARCFRLPVVPAQCKSGVTTTSRGWFYDARSASCRQLSFEECSAPDDGSDSGFETLEECIATCLRQPSSGADAVVNTTTNVADDVTTSPIPSEEETSTTAGLSLPSSEAVETQQPGREAAETADENDGKMSPDGNAKQLETDDSTDSDTKDNSADDVSSVNGNDGDARADDVPSTPSEGLAVRPNNELPPSVGGDADTNETSSSGVQQQNEPKAKRFDNADGDVPPIANNGDERSGNSKNEEKTDSNAVVSTKLADNVGNDLSADMTNQSAVTSDGRLPQSSSYSEDARYRSTLPVVGRDQSSKRSDSAEKTLLPPPAGNDRRAGLLNFIRIIVRQNGKVRPRDDGRRKNRFGKSDIADESDDRIEDSEDVKRKRDDLNGKQFSARKSSNQRYAAQKLSQALSQLPTRNKKPVAKATSSAKSIVPSSRPYMCQLPAVRGYCYGRMPRWYFNAAANRCQLFIYTGCGGNINNFKHLMACVSTCSVDVEPPTVNSSCLDGSCMTSDDDDDDTMPKQSSNKRQMTQLPMMRSYSAQQLPDLVEYPVQRSSRGRASGQPQDRSETGTLRTITIMMPVRFNEGIAMPSFSPDSDVSDSSSVPLNLEMSRPRTGSSVPKQFSLNNVMADAAQSRQERRMPSNRQSSQDATSAVLAGSLPLPVSHKFFIPALMAQTQPLMPRDSPMPLLQQQSDSQQPPANVQSGQKQQKKQQQQRQQQLVQLPWSQQHQQAQLVTLPWQRQSVPQRSVAAPANRLPDSAVLKNDLVMTSISYGLLGGRSTPDVNQRVQEDAGRFGQRYPFIGFTANRLMPLQNSGMPMAAAAAGRNIPLNRGFQMFVEEEENLPPVAMKQQMAFDGNQRADASPNKPRRRLPPNADRRQVNDDDDESGRRDYEYRRPRPTEPSRQRSSGSSTRRSSSSSRSRLSTKRGSSSKRYQNKSSRYRDSKRGSWRYDADRYSPPTRYDNRLPMPLQEERYELTPATSGKLTMFQIVVRRQQDIAHQGFIQPPAPQQQQQQQLPPRGWSPIDTLADALMQTHGDLTQPPAAGVRERTPVPLQTSASVQQPPQPTSDAREMETARGERRNNVEDDDDNDDDSPPQIVVVADDAADDKNQPSYVCFLPVDIGNCKSYQNKWFFNAKSGRCQLFFYGGCGGNGNRFDKLESCQRICAPSDTGSATQSSPTGNQTPADDVVPPTLAPPPVSPPSQTPAEAAVVVNDDVVSTTPEPEPEQTTEPYEGDVIIVTSPVYVPMTIEQLEEYERNTQTSNESHVDSQGQGHVPDHGDSEHGAAHDDHHIVSDVYSAAVPGFSTQYIAIVSVLGAVGLVVIILVIITIVRLCRRYYKSKKEMVVEDVMKAHMYGDLPQVVYTQTAGVIGKLDEKL